jgi:alpha-amylase/alpha-mannosidase (GH57 family)
MKDRTVLVVHGHFYQPPRENPWTDNVEEDPTAAPFANWNARIDAECYRPNAYPRIYDGKNRIAGMSNNFAHMSFNIGPTLGRWLDHNDGDVARRIRQGNDEQRARLSSGGAMAQVWSHPIAPLLSRRDLGTQIRWGMADFRRRFGYDPAGMWLPETAANEATLAALIDAGIAFTVVAPEQIRAVRPPGGNWQEVTIDSVDTGRAYRFLHPDGSGRSLSLCVFDGPLSRDLAFGNAIRDASSVLAAVERSAARSKAGGQRLVLAASDGELYGHHKKFAELALAYALGVAAPSRGVKVTNLQAFLAESPPTWEARLHRGEHGEGTAWSCSHGLGRWLRDCGCRMNSAKARSQAWRTPLRQALDLLRDGAAEFFESAAAALFLDPWRARDEYGDVHDEALGSRQQYVRRVVKEGLSGSAEAETLGLLLLEMQRSLLLMYTSCAWFYDDIAGVESGIALRWAAHAIDLWKRLGGHPPEEAFVARLAEAHSNDARMGTGGDAFARAEAARVTADQVVAREVFARLLSRKPSGTEIAGFALKSDRIDSALAVAGASTIAGQADVTEARTGIVSSLAFSASCDEVGGLACNVEGRRIALSDLLRWMARPLRLMVLAKLARNASQTQAVSALLEGVDTLGEVGASDAPALASLLVRAAGNYLNGLLAQSQKSGDQEYSPALRLVELAGSLNASPPMRRVQDLVCEHLEEFRRRHLAPPKALQALAERAEPARWASEAKPKK